MCDLYLHSLVIVVDHHLEYILQDIGIQHTWNVSRELYKTWINANVKNQSEKLMMTKSLPIIYKFGLYHFNFVVVETEVHWVRQTSMTVELHV